MEELNQNQESVKKVEETKPAVSEVKPTQPTLAQPTDHTNIIHNAIIKSAEQTNDIKNIIDLAATGVALEDKNTTVKLVTEKTAELKADAEAKRIESETSRIRAEVEKVREEANKEIAAIQAERDALQADVEKLRQLDDKANAFFETNKSILKCAGVRQKLSLGVMRASMIPATTIFVFFQVLLLPLTLVGFVIESLTDILGSLCGGFAKNGIKIIVAMISLVLIGALVFGVYWIAIKLGFNL